MSRKDVLNNLFTTKLGAPNRQDGSRKGTHEPVRSGAVSAMNSVLDVMANGAKAADDLRQQLASGSMAVEIDPALIDGSTISDRIATADDPEFDRLVESIRGNGQEVPILVRPSPNASGRYQVAFGRRRLRAAAVLGITVKSVVRQLTDAELVIAQGTENSVRQDLSFIEKAFFARRLEDAGYDRSTIMAALAADKSDLSRYISVARMLPEVLIEAIGPAPKAGRARWAALAERLEKPDASKLVEAIVVGPEFLKANTDSRFAIVFDALIASPPKRRSKGSIWQDPQGKRAARIEMADGKTTIAFDEKHVPNFAAFVAQRLDALYREFTASEQERTPTSEDDR